MRECLSSGLKHRWPVFVAGLAGKEDPSDDDDDDYDDDGRLPVPRCQSY